LWSQKGAGEIRLVARKTRYAHAAGRRDDARSRPARPDRGLKRECRTATQSGSIWSPTCFIRHNQRSASHYAQNLSQGSSSSVAHNSRLAVARLGRRPRLTVSPAGETWFRPAHVKEKSAKALFSVHVRPERIELSTSVLSGQRSTTELRAHFSNQTTLPDLRYRNQLLQKYHPPELRALLFLFRDSSRNALARLPLCRARELCTESARGVYSTNQACIIALLSEVNVAHIRNGHEK
jgi:hypothetical protein